MLCQTRPTQTKTLNQALKLLIEQREAATGIIYYDVAAADTLGEGLLLLRPDILSAALHFAATRQRCWHA
jgi:hypothetical protein